MFRFASSMLLLSLVLSAAACGDSAQLASQAIAAPANTQDRSWQSSVSPTAVEDTAKDYE